MTPVYVVIFLSASSFSAVVPFLVFLVMKDGGNAFVLGVIGAIFWAAQFFGASWLGPLSDRVGRKRVLLQSQLGALLAWSVFLVATFLYPTELARLDNPITGAFVLTVPVVMVAISRALEGLLDSSVSITNAYVSDLMPGSKVGFARLSIATNSGFILGPLFAGHLADGEHGISIVAGIAVGACALGALACLALPNVKPKAATTEAVLESGGVLAHKLLGGPCRDAVPCPPKSLMRATLQIPALRPLFAIYFAVYLGFSIFTSAMPIHAARDLGWDGSQLGAMFSILAGTLVATQWFLLPIAGRHLSDASLGLVGTVLVAASYLAMTSGSSPVLYVGAVLYGVGNGLAWPSYLALLARSTPKELQGSSQGVGSSVGSMASIFGTLFGGALFEGIGVATFLIAATSLVVAALLFATTRAQKSASSTTR